MTAQTQESASVMPQASVAGARAGVLAGDWKFVLAVLVVALALTSIPYLYAMLTSPPDRQFVGIIYNVPDVGQYFAWMRASQDSVFISNTLTSEPNAPLFFNLVFWIQGNLASALGISLPTVFFAFRLFSAALLVVVAYSMCGVVLADLRQRRIAFLLIIFSAGLTAFIVALNKLHVPFEFSAQHVAEGNSLFSMMAFPLLTFGMALFTLIFIWAIRAYQTGKQRYAVAAGIVGLVLGWSHGYDLILVYSVLFIFSLVALLRDGWNWRWVLSGTLIFLLSVTPSLYFLRLTVSDTVWREVLAQFGNAGVFSPNPLNLLLLMGLPLLLAILTFQGIFPLRDRPIAELFVQTWLIVQFFLIYLPVDYQIHFINGWQIPICILATIGIFRYIVPYLKSMRFGGRFRLRSGTPLVILLAGVLLIVLVIPTNLYLVGWRVLDMSRHQPPYFLLDDEFAAFNWLRQNTTRDDIVLSSLDTGQYVPGFAGNRTYLAHWANTLHFFQKRDQVQRFFDAKSDDAARRALLERGGIRYLVYGEAERKLGGWDPSASALVRRVWASPRVEIFQVETREQN